MEIPAGSQPYDADIGERIRAVRRSKKMTQKDFAASVGIVQGFLCSVEKGRKSPSTTLIIALQYLYSINPEWLAKGSGEMFTGGSQSLGSGRSGSIPLYENPPATLDSLTLMPVKEYISMPEADADCFAFEYSGDFMSPTIRDGDVIIIKPGSKPVHGDIILIVGQWGDSFLRRYRMRGEDIFCSADNSSYSAFKPDKNTKILGTVHAVWRKIRF